MSDPYVRSALVVFGRGRSEELPEPEWPAIEQALALLGTPAGGCRLDLASEDGRAVMTIFAEAPRFHLGLVVDETCFYYLSNGHRPTGRRLDVAGDVFEEHLVLEDRLAITAAAHEFFLHGSRLESGHWLEETIG